ncbi:MAG: S49 family peptidase [bacterium]
MLRLVFVLFRNVLNIFSYVLLLPFFVLKRRFFRPDEQWVRIRLSGALPIVGPAGLGRWFQNAPTFLQMRRNIKAIADSKDIDTVLIDIRDPGMGPSVQREVKSWIGNIRDSGKRVIAYSDSFSTSTYALASTATEIVMPPSGRLYTFRPRSEQIFANKLLTRLGILPQFLHIGAFKTASHRFIRSEGTTAQRGMTDELLDGMSRLTTEHIQESRGLNADEVARLFEAPVDAGLAKHRNFIHGEGFATDFPEHPDHRDYLDSVLKLEVLPFRRPAVIALVDLTGFIVTPDMQVPTNGPVIDSGVVVPLLERLAKNPRIRGVILHIDSPGGSALASDLIWHSVANLTQEKPVVAWCTNVVASGGYYIAVGANAIVCTPESIVGSIGVIAGKFAVRGLAEHADVRVEVHGDDSTSMMSLVDPLAGKGLATLTEDTRRFYTRFLERVGMARNIAPRRLHRYARGRVYLGEPALSRNLVDGIGGFEEAVARIHALCELSEDKTVFRTFGHRSPSLKAAIRSSILGRVVAQGMSAVEDDAVVATLLKHQEVLALMPQSYRW